MKQEDKDLLLTYLSMALAFGVKLKNIMKIIVL